MREKFRIFTLFAFFAFIIFCTIMSSVYAQNEETQIVYSVEPAEDIMSISGPITEHLSLKNETIYVLPNVFYRIRVVETKLENVKKFRSTYTPIGGNSIRGTLKVFRDNKTVKEVKAEKDNEYPLSLNEEGDYTILLESEEGFVGDTKRDAIVVKEKILGCRYLIGNMYSNEADDVIYTSKTEHFISFELTKGVQAEYFQKIVGFSIPFVQEDNELISEEWIPIIFEKKIDARLELLHEGKIEEYYIDNIDDPTGEYESDEGYRINLEKGGIYKLRMIDPSTGEIIAGSEREIEVVDFENSTVPFILTIIPLIVILAIIWRRYGK